MSALQERIMREKGSRVIEGEKYLRSSFLVSKIEKRSSFVETIEEHFPSKTYIY